MTKLQGYITEALTRADELAVLIERAEINGKDVASAQHALSSQRHALAHAKEKADALEAALGVLHEAAD